MQFCAQQWSSINEARMDTALSVRAVNGGKRMKKGKEKISANSLFYIFYCCSSAVVSITTPPHHPPHPSPPLTLEPTRLWLCPCVLYTCSLMAFPLFFLSIPLHLPLWLLPVCSLFQCPCFYFACLFCWLCSTYRWDHMVFVFHHLAYFT